MIKATFKEGLPATSRDISAIELAQITALRWKEPAKFVSECISRATRNILVYKAGRMAWSAENFAHGNRDRFKLLH